MNIFLHKSLPLSVGGVLLGMISFLQYVIIFRCSHKRATRARVYASGLLFGNSASSCKLFNQ